MQCLAVKFSHKTTLSLDVLSFICRPPGKVVTDKVSDSGRMYATNFHANADKRLETHCTTAQDGFQPVAMQGVSHMSINTGKMRPRDSNFMDSASAVAVSQVLFVFIIHVPCTSIWSET